MISLPQFKKRRSELHSELDKWLYLLCNAAKSKKLPTFGNKNIAEALERIKVDRASDKLLTAQEISMSLKEDLESYFAGKIIDARQDERLILARNLFNMGKLTPAEISTASGVPASTIRRWKRKR